MLATWCIYWVELRLRYLVADIEKEFQLGFVSRPSLFIFTFFLTIHACILYYLLYMSDVILHHTHRAEAWSVYRASHMVFRPSHNLTIPLS